MRRQASTTHWQLRGFVHPGFVGILSLGGNLLIEIDVGFHDCFIPPDEVIDSVVWNCGATQ